MRFNKSSKLVLIFSAVFLFQSCYFINFFRKKRSDDSSGSNSDIVLGDDLGAKAGERNLAALASVYSVSATKPPAPVRPDPDVSVRRLLRQFRPEGTTMARTIGKVENFRTLLGGASLDFSVAPSVTYDATSVLAAMKVAEEVCRALVSPSDWEYPGWSSVLPLQPSESRENLKFLLQRFTGVSSSKIESTKIDSLETILNNSKASDSLTAEDYINPCIASLLDAQAMLL